MEENKIFEENEILELIEDINNLTADSIGEFSFGRGEE